MPRMICFFCKFLTLLRYLFCNISEYHAKSALGSFFFILHIESPLKAKARYHICQPRKQTSPRVTNMSQIQLKSA